MEHKEAAPSSSKVRIPAVAEEVNKNLSCDLQPNKDSSIVKKLNSSTRRKTEEESEIPATTTPPQNSETASCRFKCDVCEKAFPTHQSLGGHRSSHNKTRLTIINTNGRFGPVVNRKRKPSSSSSNKNKKKKKKKSKTSASLSIVFDIDLNLPPKEEEEEEDVVGGSSNQVS